MKNSYFSTFQLILLGLFAALVVVSKIALRLPLRVPGHSGLFWMAIMLVVVQVVPRRGAASLVGLTSGLMAGFLGLGDFGMLNTFLSYTAVGVFTDLAVMLVPYPDNPAGAMLIGAIGHSGKFLVKWLLGILSGAPLGFVALGLVYSSISYVIFGALGGLLGVLTVRALRRAGFFAYLAEKR
jgi:hypothetical protein